MKRQMGELCALIGIDKPHGMTSHDVVNRVRRATGERRVGHAGTLDPAATGVMVVGVGPATRLMQFLSAERKSYVAQIAFGTQTTTDDAEGEVMATASVPAQLSNSDFARSVLQRLLGAQMQVPPAYSAISKNGVRSYVRARAGEAVELEPRSIYVYAAELLGVHVEAGVLLWDVVFSVSKGTYIRALARDLGQLCNTAAHLKALRRSASGSVSLAQCTTLDALAALEKPVAPAQLAPFTLNPLDALALPYRVLTPQEEARRQTGAHLPLGTVERLGSSLSAANKPALVALVFNAQVVGVWQVAGNELVCNVNLPLGVQGATLNSRG